MRVLHVIPSISAVHGGPSAAIRTIVAATSALGADVEVATTDDDGPGRRLEPAADAASRAIDGMVVRLFPKQTELYKVSQPLLRWLRGHVPQYDVVHVHALFSFPSVVGAWVARSQGVPYVVRPVGVLDHYGMTARRRGWKALSFRLVERRLLRDAAAVHFTSAVERAEASSLGVAMSAIVVPLAVEPFAGGDAERFLERHPIARGRKRILFLSRIDPKKNLEALIEAIATIARRADRPLLLVAGSGEAGYVESLSEQAGSRGIGESVIWLGHVAGQEKADALAAADLFVLPSHSENFGIAAAEALAAGLPCVLGKGVAISADVEHAGAGLAVEPTGDAVASAIARLLNDEAGRVEAAVAARRLADGSYSPRNMGESLLALYERVAAERRGRRA